MGMRKAIVYGIKLGHFFVQPLYSITIISCLTIFKRVFNLCLYRKSWKGKTVRLTYFVNSHQSLMCMYACSVVPLGWLLRSQSTRSVRKIVDSETTLV